MDSRGVLEEVKMYNIPGMGKINEEPSIDFVKMLRNTCTDANKDLDSNIIGKFDKRAKLS